MSSNGKNHKPAALLLPPGIDIVADYLFVMDESTNCYVSSTTYLNTNFTSVRYKHVPFA